MELKTFMRRREISRDLVKKCCNSHSSDATKDFKTLRKYRDTLLHFQTELMNYDLSILNLIKDDDDIAQEEVEISNYKMLILEALSSINCDLDSLNLKGASAIDEKSFVKLPQLQIAHFAGDPLKWQEFWDSFQAVVHEKDSLTSVLKFNYLLSFLDGDAKRALEGIAVTNDNYPEAIKILNERFGRKDVVIFAHLNKLFSLPVSTNGTQKLRQIYDECEKHLRCLNVTGTLTVDQVFVPLILSKLPHDVQVLMQRKNGSKKWELSSLRESLKEEIEARELVGAKFSDGDSCENKSFNKSSVKSSSSALMARTHNAPRLQKASTAKKNHPSCIFCEESHYSNKCTSYPDVNSRSARLFGKCHRCFKTDHVTNLCQNQRPCYFCNDVQHHTCLCPIKFRSQESKQVEHPLKTNTMNVFLTSRSDEVAEFQTLDNDSGFSEQSVMQSAVVEVSNPQVCTGNELVRLILDTGSQKSYVTEKLAKKLELKADSYEILSMTVFGATKKKSIKVGLCELRVFCLDGLSITIKVNIVPVISCAVDRSISFLDVFPQLSNYIMADNRNILTDESVDLLIGGDYYYMFVKEDRINITPNFLLLDTAFGWVTAGRIKCESKNAAHALLTTSSKLECIDLRLSLERFWTLESIGIVDSTIFSDDEVAMQMFQSSVQFSNGRYSVSWPWKNEIPNLPDNYYLCLGRLKSLLKRLSEKPEVLCNYNNIIEDQLQKGIIEKVEVHDVSDSRLVHYIPHQCIVRPDKQTTKLRIVYDASAKITKNSLSLNECLHRGPIIMEDLSAIIMRFRLNPIAISCDIEKAFLQVGLQEMDRDVTRFIWLKDSKNLAIKNNTQIFRFCRVPFGVISSPFLLSATIKHHFQSQNNLYTERVLKNIYVDNIIDGTSTVHEALEMYHELKKTMMGASMNLREWSSNSQELLKMIPLDDQIQASEMSVLGISWNTIKDEISLKFVSQHRVQNPTKKAVLQEISRVFDPMGLFAPVVIRAKIFMQTLWKQNLDWCDAVPADLLDLWDALGEDLQNISDKKLSRFIGPSGDGAICELHCFCDASGRAYASAVYLVVRSNYSCTKVNLLFCKTKVAPLKDITIPRLELMAVLIGVRITSFLTKEIPLMISRCLIWSDSKCVLHWIHNEAKVMSVFIENRLKEIRRSDSVEFRFVPTLQNPADIPSRGGGTE